ncbi:unnamed protein product [Cunninghamella blakesleeana]
MQAIHDHSISSSSILLTITTSENIIFIQYIYAFIHLNQDNYTGNSFIPLAIMSCKYKTFGRKSTN